MAVFHLPWDGSRCTGHNLDIRDIGQETKEEHHAVGRRQA